MSSVDTYFEQGMAYFEAAEYEKAIEMFTKSLRLSLGDLAEMLLYRGIAYAYLEAYDKALADFNGALQRNAYFADAYNERGSLRRIQGDIDGAIQDLSMAIQIDPKHYAAYYNRGLANEQKRDYARAVADLDKTLAINPTIATAYEARGRVRAALHEFGGAIQDLERYLRMGGGREFDNHSEIQSLILSLRVNRLLSRVIPARFLPTPHA